LPYGFTLWRLRIGGPFNKIEAKHIEQVIMNPLACQEHVNDENLPSIIKTKHPTKGGEMYKMEGLKS